MDHARKRRALCAASLLAVLLAACAPGPHVMLGTVRMPPTTLPDLAFTDSRGAPFHLSALHGRITLVYFGFTSCPDLCPTTLVELQQVRKKLGSDAAKVAVVFVTLDPERDTPTQLARYVALFDPTFTGLTGTSDQLAAARSAFGVTATKRELPSSALAYTIDHSSLVYVIDRTGAWREQFEHGTPVGDIVSDLRELLREKETK